MYRYIRYTELTTYSLYSLVTFTEEILYGKLHFLCSDFNAFQYSAEWMEGIETYRNMEMKWVDKGVLIPVSSTCVTAI